MQCPPGHRIGVRGTIFDLGSGQQRSSTIICSSQLRGRSTCVTAPLSPILASSMARMTEKRSRSSWAISAFAFCFTVSNTRLLTYSSPAHVVSFSIVFQIWHIKVPNATCQNLKDASALAQSDGVLTHQPLKETVASEPAERSDLFSVNIESELPDRRSSVRPAASMLRFSTPSQVHLSIASRHDSSAT